MTNDFWVSKKMLPEIEGFERFMPKPYLCPAGKWTIGIGHVITDNEQWDQISKAQAYDLLVTDLSQYARKMWPLLTRQPTQDQFDAMGSLVFNIGVGIHDGVKNDFADSTLLDRFNAGDITGAANQFLQWDKYHDPKTGELKVLDGLHIRRSRERAIFLGQWS